MQNKSAIIAGNAKSLAEIDYSYLTNNLDSPPPTLDNSKECLDSLLSSFDIFRCNQFYFEDKYFLGKNVKFAFATSHVLFEQYYTLQTLKYKGEYDIENIVVSDFALKHVDWQYYNNLEIFKNCIAGSSYIEKLKEFFAFMQYNEIYLNRRITSGIYMCAFAAALGYKDIYICGIDFYKNKQEVYAFNAVTPNLKTMFPNFSTTPDNFHSADIDLEALNFLRDKYNVNFYSICKNSPISQYIPLPTPKYQLSLELESKKEDSIRDILIPSNNSYNNLYFTPPKIVGTTMKHKNRLRENLLYRLLKDIIRIPVDIKRYIVAKSQEK